MKEIWSAAHRTAHDFLEDEPFQLAAATSYYTLLALAPLLIITIAVAGLVFEREAVQENLVVQMRDLVGPQGAQAIQTVIANSTGPEKGTSLALGIVMLLVGASGVFMQLQTALNKIWNVKADPKRNAWREFVRHRLLSLAMVLAIGFLLLVSLVISTALSAVASHFEPADQAVVLVWQVVNAFVSLFVITLFFALLFKFLPDAKIAWRHVGWGALLTALLFTLGKYLIGSYLGRAGIGSSFGAAGSVVALTVWVYYASLIVFLGAEVTQVHARRTGDSTPPEEFAKREAR